MQRVKVRQLVIGMRYVDASYNERHHEWMPVNHNPIRVEEIGKQRCKGKIHINNHLCYEPEAYVFLSAGGKR